MNSRHGFLFAAAAAVLFLGAVHVPAPSALFQLNCRKSQTVDECFEKYFNDVLEFTERDSEKLFAALDAAVWEGLDGDNAADCQKVLNAVNDAYYGGRVDLYTGMPDWQAQAAAADSGIVVAGYLPHPDGAAILFHSSLLDFKHDLLSSALHEAAHHAGIGHDDEFSNGDAEKCAKIPVKEDEDDDDPGEGGGDPVEPVCEEKLVAVYYVVYEREYRTGDTCLSSDDADGADWCSGVGKWVKVRTTKVKWETQTVCSS